MTLHGEIRTHGPAGTSARRLPLPKHEELQSSRKVKLFVANTRGFCAGVVRAEQIVEIVARTERLQAELEGRKPRPIFTDDEFVHNIHVVRQMQEGYGVTVQTDPSKLPNNSIWIYSAHGYYITPEVGRDLNDRKIQTFDTTCPLVHKVHMEIGRVLEKGYTVLYYGHRGHKEAESSKSRGLETVTNTKKGRIVILESVDELQEFIKTLGRDERKRVYVNTQTTVSADEFERFIQEAKRLLPDLQTPPKDDICYATFNRQVVAKMVAKEVGPDGRMIVVGSATSSNSLRLKEVIESMGTPVYFIDDATQIRPEWFGGVTRIGLTSGASAPDALLFGGINYEKEVIPGVIITLKETMPNLEMVVVGDEAINAEEAKMKFGLPPAIARMQKYYEEKYPMLKTKKTRDFLMSGQ